MKDLIAFVFLLISALSTNAQTMPKVAGVTFGQSYENCKSILDQQYNNGQSSYQLTANELEYRDVRFGGSYFDYVDFEFQVVNGTSHLFRIEFVSRFDLSDSKMAKAQRDALLETFKEKYELRWGGLNDDGYAYYVLGYNPINTDDGFVVIQTSKGKSKGGRIFLWTTVTYGPIYTVDVKDEI